MARPWLGHGSAMAWPQKLPQLACLDTHTLATRHFFPGLRSTREEYFILAKAWLELSACIPRNVRGCQIAPPNFRRRRTVCHIFEPWDRSQRLGNRRAIHWGQFSRPSDHSQLISRHSGDFGSTSTSVLSQQQTSALSQQQTSVISSRHP